MKIQINPATGAIESKASCKHLTAASDSVKIGDGNGNFATLTHILDKFALDVNIAGGSITASISLPTGQQTMANSVPMVIASDQTAIPVYLATPGAVQNVIINYNEITGIATGIYSTVVTYVVPALKSAVLQKVFVSGENVAKYDVYINGNIINTRRTNYTMLNEIFDFLSTGNTGYVVSAGDQVILKVLHDRPNVSKFEGTIQVIEIG